MGGWAARKALQVVANVEYGQCRTDTFTLFAKFTEWLNCMN